MEFDAISLAELYRRRYDIEFDIRELSLTFAPLQLHDVFRVRVNESRREDFERIAGQADGVA